MCSFKMMNMENPVVKLCAEGMSLEAQGRLAQAAKVFAQAWENATDDYEASVAAHYVARHQDSPAEALRWNQISLDRANSASEEKVRGFYPSLYLNMGKAHEDLGYYEEAKHFYTLALDKFGVLSGDRYGDVVRDAVQRGLDRVAAKAASR
jgi:tetratricopeptide (TPR) repeat protein